MEMRCVLQSQTSVSVMSWDCGFKYLFTFPPTLKAGVMCKLQEQEDIGRLELIQKLAKENCHLLDADKTQPKKTDEVRYLFFVFFSPGD